jgi:hypothetical protein
MWIVAGRNRQGWIAMIRFLRAGGRLVLVAGAAAAVVVAAPLTRATAAWEPGAGQWAAGWPAVARSAPATSYGMIDLGALAGVSDSSALGINGRGVAVGYSGAPVPWQHGRIADLGTPPGSTSTAVDVSERGDVVGRSDDRAVSWRSNRMTTLPPLVGDTSGSTRGAEAAGGPATGSLTPVRPVRILDTTSTLGGHKAPLAAGETMNLQVLGANGIPGAGVSAVLVNVTAVAPSTGGYLTLFPTGATRPTASTLSFAASQTVANSALVRVGSNGRISIYNNNGNTTVVIDVEGWVGYDASPADAKVTTTTPARILDTRNNTGGRNGRALAARETMRLAVLGTNGIPASGVSAVAVNLTAVAPTANSYIVAYSTDTPRPGVATISFPAGLAVSNFAVIPVGADGAINIYNSAGSVHVVMDVQGWIASGNPVAAAGYRALQTPSRILDTRSGQPLGAAQTTNLQVLAVGGVPASGVASVTLHITTTNASTNGYIALFPAGTSRPGVSALQTNPSRPTCNTITVAPGPTGAVSIYNNTGTTDVIVDVQAWSALPDLTVTPPVASRLSGGLLTSADGQRAALILNNSNRYAMLTWWPNVAPGLLANPVAANDNIRRLGMQALGLSTSLATGTYDPAIAGVSAATATARTIQVIDVASANHIANKAGGWYSDWQSTLWSSFIGRAAWQLWPDLDARVRANAARMINYEADAGAGKQVLYLRNRAGTVLRPGNTGAEEVSWYALPIQLARVMFPGHPHQPVWRYAIAQYALASWARPADVNNTTVVNGAPISSWINGSNVEANGLVINHDRIAPDYAATMQHNGIGIVVDSLAGVSAPAASTTLLAPVYSAYRSVTFASPPYAAPGGQIYMTGSGSIYYPQGNDWGTGMVMPYAIEDAQSAAFGFAASFSAQYETLHANAQLAMQNRFADRHTYANNQEYNSPDREEVIAQQAAELYLTKWVREKNLTSFTNESYWLSNS